MDWPRPVPVLMFHDVEPAGRRSADPYSIDRDGLARLLDQLVELGLHAATLDELLGDRARWPAVVLTFDDARRGVLEQALPLLQARGQRGVVYAISDRTTGGRDGYLDGDGLRVLQQAGWTIGTHGATHRHLTGLTLDELRAEWRRSKAELEQLLGQPVLHGSYPGGRGREREQAEARAAGLQSVATSVPGLWRAAAARFAIPRLVARRGRQGEQLRHALDGDWRWLLPALLRHHGLGLPKRLLGDRRYDALRKWLLGVGAGEEG